MDKYFATVPMGRYAVGDELKESAAVGNALVLLGKARKETTDEPAKAATEAPRRRGRPPRVQGSAVGVATTQDFTKTTE